MSETPWRTALFERLVAERKFGRDLLERGRIRPELYQTPDFANECSNWIESLAFAINFAFDGQAHDFQETILTEPVIPKTQPDAVPAAYHDWIPRFTEGSPSPDDLRLYVSLLEKWIDRYSDQVDLESALRLQFLGFLVSHGGMLTQRFLQMGCRLERPVFKDLCDQLLAEKTLAFSNGVFTLTTRGANHYEALARQEHTMNLPGEIRNSVARFRTDYPNPDKTGFVIMRFGSTPAHERILDAIRTTLSTHNLVALRADDKQYHDDLYYNIMTYMYGCGFGIAVYERLESEDFNPNVSLEVGGMLVMGKPVCFLKDKTLRTLNTDIIGKLYRQFDPQDPKPTIARELTKWLKDKGLA